MAHCNTIFHQMLKLIPDIILLGWKPSMGPAERLALLPAGGLVYNSFGHRLG